MLTSEEINFFVAALDAIGYGICEDDVVETRDKIEDFNLSRKMQMDQAQLALGANATYHYALNFQIRKGWARGDLIVMDFGAARAAYFSGQSS